MLEIKELVKKYGETAVFEDMNFSFPNKGLVCLLGPSGSGKSTLLNMLAGFDSDYSGEIIVGGTSISEMTADELCAYRRSHIGFIFQNYHLLSGYTVLENILLSSALNTFSEEENEKRAQELIMQLGLAQKADEKIENLSGGQKQRVAIARALISNPRIILADEPTGALDRRNSDDVMAQLKAISKDRLVIVITHDKKVCRFADEIIRIEDKNIIVEGTNSQVYHHANNDELPVSQAVKVSSFKHGLKNFKVHRMRYIAVSLAISIGVLAFMLSLSSGNIMDQSIAEFKEKNVAFSNGYIQGKDDGATLDLLTADKRIENVYYQYKMTDVTLEMDEKTELMVEKYPMAKATEKMSYGRMPKTGEKEIALSPSLAKKFGTDISKLLGKKLTVTYGKEKYPLTISGIYNAGYDDFFVSSDIEQEFYGDMKDEENYSISYDVTVFEEIVAVSNMLADKKIESKTFAKEVEALQSTFNSLQRLFLIVSVLVLAIALFIGTVLLVKLQNSRYKELGLLSALGFTKGMIRKMIVSENILLAAMAVVFQAVLIGGTYVMSALFDLALIIAPLQMFLSIIATGVVVSIIGLLASRKLINTEPALALKK